MLSKRIKRLVENGEYQPRPELVAEAMLHRPGVRELLSEDVVQLNPGGRSRRAELTGHRAA
jgi:hypothetical protein